MVKIANFSLRACAPEGGVRVASVFHWDSMGGIETLLQPRSKQRKSSVMVQSKIRTAVGSHNEQYQVGLGNVLGQSKGPSRPVSMIVARSRRLTEKRAKTLPATISGCFQLRFLESHVVCLICSSTTDLSFEHFFILLLNPCKLFKIHNILYQGDPCTYFELG